MVKKTIFAFLFSMFLMMESVGAESLYIVRNGDTFSQIARRFFGVPVYESKSGALIRLKLLNPQLENFDIIYPGQNIQVAESMILDEPRPAVNLPLPEPSPLKPHVSTAALPDAIYEIVPRAYFSSLDGFIPSSNSSATLVSRMNWGLSLRWHQVWNKDFRSYLGLGWHREVYIADILEQSRVENPIQDLLGFSAGGRWHLGNETWIETEMAYRENIFYRSNLTNDGIVFEPLVIPYVQIGVRKKFVGLVYAPYVAGAIILSGESSRPSYKVQSGQGYSVKAGFTQPMKDIDLAAELFFIALRQDTSIVEIYRKEIGLSVSIQWKWRKNEK